jgi:site-specific DNA-methyltransferase (adenine-specific)
MNKELHFSSATDDWATPQWLFDRLNEEFKFTLDVCASDENHKCEKYFTQAQNGLAQSWAEHACWMNPPYGRRIATWIAMAYEKVTGYGIGIAPAKSVVCLIPARTDTRYWHDYVAKASEIRLLRGRLKFGYATASAPFPSAVVIFRPDTTTTGLVRHVHYKP